MWFRRNYNLEDLSKCSCFFVSRADQYGNASDWSGFNEWGVYAQKPHTNWQNAELLKKFGTFEEAAAYFDKICDALQRHAVIFDRDKN